MSTPGVSGGGFDFFITSVGGKWSWRVLANNIQGYGQLFYIGEIVSPWGRYQDVSQPIPGAVVTAMAESLETFQQQLSPLLYLTSASSFTATVSEGDVPSAAGIATFINNGAFGSFMTVAATPNSAWLTANPTSLNSIGKSQAGQVTGMVNPAIMLAASSPYVGVINLQDNRDTPTIVPVAFTITVLPRPTIGLSTDTITFTYNIAANSLSVAQTIQVENTGPATSLLSATLAKLQDNSPWLSFTPEAVGPLESGETTDVTFTPNSAGITRVPGTYTETISVISQNATNTPATLTVELVVT